MKFILKNTIGNIKWHKMRHLLFIWITCLELGGNVGYAQQNWPFYEKIQEFKTQDSLSFPTLGGILFIGSSSIARWDDLQERLNGYPVIQRGFGGSQFQDILHYSEDILFPYRPSKIFIYAGENDFNAGKSVEEVFGSFLKIYERIRARLPTTHICFISVKPSVKLEQFGPSILQLNQKVKEFIEQSSCHISYVDIHQPMLDDKGMPRPELFLPDDLHLNKTGYDVWEVAIRNSL